MEGVGGVAAVGGGVRQRLDDLVELHNRSGPAVGDQQRPSLGRRAWVVNEVDAQALDGGLELGKAVHQRLTGRPVVVLRPVTAKLLSVGQRDALAPVVGRFGFRPSGGGQAALQVLQVCGRHVDGEGFDCAHGCCGSCCLRTKVKYGECRTSFAAISTSRAQFPFHNGLNWTAESP